jgi:2-polyprenyl-6-hydroxyphenyl methylase/3-demethylubiquinone-9 3-methyltransferase
MVQSYGPKSAKRHLWNEEFATGRWNFLDQAGEQSVHGTLEKYAGNGSILDLGCGSGTTSVELNADSYSLYTGVDIADVAVEKATARAQEAGRAGRNEYFQSDILTYEPARPYDVILFGDSIYYVPFSRIAAMLKRYSAHLTSRGVFVARIFDVSGKHQRIIDIIESHCETIEKQIGGKTNTCIIVFRPRL